MKPITTIARAVGLLEKMYRVFNRTCFNDRLHDCTITIEKQKGAYIHPQYYINGDCSYWKIVMNPEHFSKPIEFVAAVLLHEMCHHAAALDGVQDCSRGGTYHNKRFKAYAEATGLLNVERDEKYGWTVTTPNDAMIDLCIENEFPEFRIVESVFFDLSSVGSGGGVNPGNPPPTPKTSNSIKHVCPVCKAIARTTKDIPLICGTCRVDMISQ